MVQPNRTRERIQLTLDRWGQSGEALAQDDGREIRVFGGIPGERVVAEVVRHQREYVAARVVEVLTPSAHRTTPPCPYFGPCTGCQWQHVDYEYQLELKKRIVHEALTRSGGFEDPPVAPTLPAPQPYGYRNHARFTVGRKRGDVGFVNRDSRSLVPVEKCLLMHPMINECLESLLGKCSETTQLSIRCGANTGDLLIQPLLKNQDIPYPTGQKSYVEALGGREFRIAASSFFQVNTSQAEQVVELIKDGLRLSGGETVVDAYAGVGTFAILLAPLARKVIAIEDSASAVHDAGANAGGLSNIEFLHGKTEDALTAIDEAVDGVVLDPPRAGCHPETLVALLRLAPRRVVYVSCEPDTLARDLGVLCQGPYLLESVQPVDMFPQTHRVECVATLSREEPNPENREAQETSAARRVPEIVLASSSPRRRQLLSGLSIEFQVESPTEPEDILPEESVRETVERLSLSKASAIAQSRPAAPPGNLVLGADSLVVLEGRALGKPADAAEARRMLESLRDREHQVVTGVSIVDTTTGRTLTASQVSSVVMRAYSDAEIESYVRSGEPMDKAGAYAVQDRVFCPAAAVEGCYTNVMGLPLCLVVDMLRESGLQLSPESDITVPDECRECPLKGDRLSGVTPL